MKYDDADWHYTEDFPEEYAGVHIALYLKWCFLKGWAGNTHLEEWPEDVKDLITGNLSATQFLCKNCDNMLTSEDLNEEGNLFTRNYYESCFLDDFSENFGNFIYTAPEKDFDFKKFTAMCDSKLYTGELKKTTRRRKIPWWKFWKKK